MKNINEFLLNLKYAFRFNKPLLTARLASALIKSSVFKKPPLRYVDFSIDFACNLKCKHCFATVLRDPRRKKMSTDDYHKVAKDCMKLGTVNFSFQGGEPIMMKNLPDIIRSCQPSLFKSAMKSHRGLPVSTPLYSSLIFEGFFTSKPSGPP